jgi:hypothetical protein
MKRIVLTTTVACIAVLSLLVSSAWAGEPGPGWVVYSSAAPTNFSAVDNEPINGGVDNADGYNVVVKNAGDRPTNGGVVTVSDTLPTGISPVRVEGRDIGPGFASEGETINQQHPTELSCELRLHSVACTDGQPVGPGDVIYLSINVHVSPGLQEGERVVNTATVSGGGAPSASKSLSTTISSTPAPFGFESMSFEATGLDGFTDTQAGDHPYEFTTTFYLNTAVKPVKTGVPIQAVEGPKDVVTDLPAGFVGDPQVVAKCSQNAVQTEKRLACPAASQIGVARLNIFGVQHIVSHEDNIVPVYNVVPDKGVAAQFVFEDGPVPTTLFVEVSQDTNYAVRVIASGIPRIADLTGISVTFFGEPLTNHDVYNESVGAAPLAFLQNPVDCAAGSLQASVSTDSWQHPGSYLPDGSPNLSDPNWKTSSTTVYPSITGCDMLQFEPAITVTPDTTQADEPTGVNVDLHVPQSTNRFPALATPELENATVTLPAGLTLSPSAADGLQACSDAQIALDSIEAGSCPDASVLGTVKISVPLLETPLEGQVYLGEPLCNPCSSADAADGNMLRIYIEAVGSGVRIKKEGHVYANPSTGQLTSRFEDNPQDPFEDLELHFKGGLRAGLATPQTCGPATTTTDLTPWSSPITPDADPISSFDVDWNGDGGACPAVPPLTPSFSAGTSNPNAGQFSPFTLTFGREDREQDLSAIQVHMPPGLLGTLSGIPLCGEPEASSGTCSRASEIGSMTVAAGSGSHPFYEKGEIYLTGPYKGAPFGLSIVVPTVAGPFNLGNVVVRSQINIDPLTAALTVTSDPFPQVIAGIPLRLRTANVTIERPGFIFNPTNCAPQQVSATIAGAQGAQAQVSAPFAVSGCAGLHFGPTFKVSTSGKTSRKDGASLDARVTFPSGAQSNIARVKVDLPKQLPSRLTTLQKACLVATFEANPAACPGASVIGVVKASTPVLPVELTGPVYFVSHAGEEFPDLIAVLQGYGVRVDLIGKTFISKAGITSSTFQNVPDVPVNSFELYLPEGPYSALGANGNLCTSRLVMPTLFTAQDGAQLKQDTPITITGCPKAKTKNAKKASKAKKARRAKRASTARKANHAHTAGGRSN